jgi:phosphoglycerate kinase
MDSEVLTTVPALAGVPLLRDQPIAPGDRWIYSAGFNVGPALAAGSRIDSELGDLRFLAAHGARVALLSHQGSARDGSAVHLDYVADHLARALGRRVGYFPENASPAARRRSRELEPGEIVLFGNTRHHPGEERNDPVLARRFAALGERAAIGGFSKAHRLHASNAGALAHLPGCAAQSLADELEALAPWAAERPDCLSVAVLGGVKAEKTLVGLCGLVDTYDAVIPGGAVLAALLAASGVDVGATEMGDRPELCVAAARDILERSAALRARVHLPVETVVAPVGGGPAASFRIRVSDGVPAGHAIVDFVLSEPARRALDGLRAGGGRALLAGTPALYTSGFRDATGAILDAVAAPGVDGMLLGGDTVAELPWHGPTSTGGGSALHFLAHGTLPVIRVLKEQ